MNSISDKYLSRKSDYTGSLDLDFEAYWDCIDMLYFSPIFQSITPLCLQQESEKSVINSTHHAKKSLSCKFMQIDTQESPIPSRKRKQVGGENNSYLKRRGQTALTQKKAELTSRLTKLKQHNAKLSKMYS
jgi:hypothetical protein